MGKKELREHQIEWVAKIDARLREMAAARVMCQMPTGGGKTIAACAVIEHWLADKPGARIWWVTHRKELIWQSADALCEQGLDAVPAGAGEWKPGHPPPMAPVVVTSPQVLRNRKKGLPAGGAEDLLVFDEAHHCAAVTWRELLAAHPGPAIGLTATPWRLSRKQGFDEMFHPPLVEGPQTADLIELGVLAGFVLYGPPLGGIKAEAEDVDSTGEFSEEKIYKKHSPTILLDNAFELWERYGGAGKQTLVYALTIQHADNLVALWRDRGRTAAAITSKTLASERDSIMAAYKAGTLETLVNVGVATEGFDIPAIGCVLVLRPTASVALYLQMMGRGLRPDPTDPTRLALLLDMTDNPHRLGRPDAIRQWSLAARGGGAVVAGEPVCRTCWDGWDVDPSLSDPCGAINPASAHYCQDCGAPFGQECPYCGRFRSWKDWVGADRCEPCLKGLAHPHLSYNDPWRISKRGNDYRALSTSRALMIFDWDHVSKCPSGVVLEERKVVRRMQLPLPTDHDEDMQRWQARRAVEHWADIYDRPACAPDLVQAAVRSYLEGDVPAAARMLGEARYAYGADRVEDRIKKGLALCAGGK